ncbi:MAG: sensor histidine kinase [Rhodothermales bacterium]
MVSRVKPLKDGWFFYNKTEALLHLVAWPLYLVLIAIPWYLGGVAPELHTVVYFFLTVLIYLPGPFYLNVFYLIPRYLQQKQWLRYIVLLVGLTLLLAVFDAVIAFVLKAEFDAQKFAYGYFGELYLKLQTAAGGLLLISIFSFGYRFTVDWIINISVIESLRAEKYAMELAFLKSQVDPHFLFNTLNSLYALALEERGDKTADGIAKLGTLMRYNLHDSQAGSIVLRKEVDYIQKYIELQRLRMNDNTQVHLQIEIDDQEGDVVRIAPMLLIPFVENAFKYGVSPTEQTSIVIHMDLQDRTFSLSVENTVIAAGTGEPGGVESGGVGLKNVEERLALLYPGKHTLSKEMVNGIYKINLSVVLT